MACIQMPHFRCFTSPKILSQRWCESPVGMCYLQLVPYDMTATLHLWMPHTHHRFLCQERTSVSLKTPLLPDKSIWSFHPVISCRKTYQRKCSETVRPQISFILTFCRLSSCNKTNYITSLRHTDLLNYVLIRCATSQFHIWMGDTWSRSIMVWHEELLQSLSFTYEWD